jgi:holliday junction DNA helicase RuvB
MIGAALRATHHAHTGGRPEPRPPVAHASALDAAPETSAPSHRPATIAQMVGQTSLIEQVRTMLKGAILRGVPPCHILVDGPPGFGKTSLAQVVATQLGTTLHTLSGPMLRQPRDLIGVLLRLEVGDVILVDEVHAAARPVLEVLYSALEDRTVPLLLGSGADARAHVARLPMFVCVSATTDPGKLPEPYRARHGLRLTMCPYSLSELSTVVSRAWERQGATYAHTEALAVAQRCKGTPRIALHLAERVLDYCACIGVDVIEGTAAAALKSFGIDEHGWDAVDHRILEALTTVFAGRTVGIDALSQAVGLERSTLETREAALAQAGLITRTSRGRMALSPAYDLVRS